MLCVHQLLTYLVMEEIEEITEDSSHKESQEKSPTEKMDVDQESQDNTTTVIDIILFVYLLVAKTITEIIKLFNSGRKKT